MVAFVWAYVVGDFANRYIKPVRILNNGKKAKSLFKYGPEIITTILLNPCDITVYDVFKFLSCI